MSSAVAMIGTLRVKEGSSFIKVTVYYNSNLKTLLLCDFLYYIDNGMLCILIRIVSIGQF